MTTVEIEINEFYSHFTGNIMNLNIAIVDDEKNQRELLSGFLQKKKYNVVSFPSGKEILQYIKNNPLDVIITDYKMPEITGYELLQKVKYFSNEIEVIIITAFGDIPLAVNSMKEGANYFLTKPVDLDELLSRLNQIKQYKELINNNIDKDKKITLTDRIIGNSPAMKEVFAKIEKVSPIDVPVLILGESGTGKELIANAIHSNSKRKNRELIKINSAAIPEKLLESELFGHTKGSFTGATTNKTGKLELADKSSLFLDEIGEIPYTVQAKLLRFFQEGEIEIIGSTKTKKVDTRIISATNRNLQNMIKDNSFREDLFYRLNVVTIEIPPLRERREDIVPLSKYFLKKYIDEYDFDEKSFTNEAIDFLKTYEWYGNVRELENTIRSALIMSYGKEIKKSDLPLVISQKTMEKTDFSQITDLNEYLNQVEKEIIKKSLLEHNYNQLKTADALNISERVLRYKITKLGLKN